MRAKGMKQAAIALELGVSEQSVRNWLNALLEFMAASEKTGK